MKNEDSRAARVVFLAEQLAAARRDLLDEGDFSPKERAYHVSSDVACATWYVEREEGELTTVTIQPANDPPFVVCGSAAAAGDWTALADHEQKRIWLLRNAMRVQRGDPRADVMARLAELELPIARLLEAWQESDRCHGAALDRLVSMMGDDTDFADYEVCGFDDLPWSAVEIDGGIARVCIYDGDDPGEWEGELLGFGRWSVVADHKTMGFLILSNDLRVATRDGEGAGHGN